MINREDNTKPKKNDTIGSEYDMGEAEYNRCLIAAELSTFVDAQRVEKPKSIFTVAQPGARKNRFKKLFNK